ncbi:MAG: response regulator transcription factor [Flavobacteriales bacterium]
MSKRVLLVDDHAIVTDGLKSLISGADDYEVVASCSNGREAIELLSHVKVDIVLMDIDMPEMNGIEATRAIKKQFDNVKIIILTMHDEKAMIKALMEDGADGYLLKNSSKEELINALNNVREGKIHLSEEANSILLKKDGDGSKVLADLTEREVEILRHIAEGLSNKEIGDQLFISHRTVDTHRTNLMQKLEVHNVAGLVRIAIQEGLV